MPINSAAENNLYTRLELVGRRIEEDKASVAYLKKNLEEINRKLECNFQTQQNAIRTGLQIIKNRAALFNAFGNTIGELERVTALADCNYSSKYKPTP